MTKSSDEIKITLIKSTIGSIPRHRKTIEALGLGKLGSSCVKKNNDATKGMIRHVRHLVNVEDV